MNFNKITLCYEDICRKIGACVAAPTRSQAQIALFVVGLALLASGLAGEAIAAAGDGKTRYNDIRIADSTNAVLTYLEGSFGALVMVAAGIGAILSASFGQYRAALGLMVVAIGAFILRSLMSTFFNDQTIKA